MFTTIHNTHYARRNRLTDLPPVCKLFPEKLRTARHPARPQQSLEVILSEGLNEIFNRVRFAAVRGGFDAERLRNGRWSISEEVS